MNKIYFIKKLCITWCLFFSCFYVFSMSKNSSSNKHYKSYFLLSDTFKISTQANIGGVYDDTLFVKKDTNFTVHFQADSGYYIDSIIINDTLFANDSINGYTFYNIQANQKIRIVFYPFCANVSEQIKFYDSASHTDSIFINAPNCRWRASTTSNWIQLFQNKDIGSKYVRFAISANTDTLNRTGFILVGNKQIAIQQFVGKKYFFVETQSNEGGNIYPQKTNIVVGDSNFIVRFTPLNNFIVDSVWVNGLYKPDSNKQYTISNIQNNYQIKVQFKYVPSTRFVTIQNGQISPVGLQIKKDTSIRFSYYPNNSYTFDYVVANGKIYKDSTTHFTLDSINYDSRIGVFFKPIGYSITVNKKYKGIRNKIDSIVSNVYPEWEPFWKKRIGGTPILNTLLPYNSTTTSIIIGNTVEDVASGIDEKGFCINTMPNLLSCEINKKITTDLLNKTTEFTLTNLLSNTTYYYRPFAKNKYGIGYGEEVSFTTLPNPNNPASNQYTLTTSITNGTITPTQNLNIGTQAKITYAASSGYKITAVYVNNIKQTGTGLISVNATNGYIWVTANTHKTISVITNNIYPPVSAGLSLANLDSNMVLVPAGSFTIGCTNEQGVCNANEMPTHQVTLSNYKICRFEVTQKLWQDVMGSNPSYFNGGSNGTDLQRPVDSVSWNDCQTFITRLNQLTDKIYRLPTEAEWEYAARGGANSTYSYIYSGGNTLNDVAWNSNNSNSQTQTVGTKQANALGLYDMSGNVWEWCNDWYGNYSSSAVTKPQGPNSGFYRIYRGGGWNNSGGSIRVSYRDGDVPRNKRTDIGLRLVITNQYTLTTTISHGSITPTQKMEEGSQLKITYTADSGYKISAVYVNNIKQIGDSVIDFTNSKGYILVTADSNKTITVITAIRYPAVSAGLNLANLDSNMVLVPAGSFTIGCTNEQSNCDTNEMPTHQVTLSNYKICRFEVTQQLWQDVMGSNPSYFNGGSNGTNLQRPVERVSWNDCQKFIDSLNKKTGKTYRLPTEAEWEYAARGGANSTYSYIYSGGNTLNDVAWNSNNSSNQTHTIGTKQANALGLYDMTGNVWEWCNDWYGNYSNSAVTNPQGAVSGSYRVIRGGSWYNSGINSRVSNRNYYSPSVSFIDFGIRLVITNQYTLTTTISHGSITPTQKIYEGSQLKITYTADSGYKISAVYVNNIKQIGDSVIDFTNSKGYILVTADSNKTITVITEDIRYPAVSAGLNLANLDSNMVPVPAGSFTMGATSEQTADGFNPWWSPSTQQVSLSNYKICRFEVTQQLWQDVMGSNPSYFNGYSYGTDLQRPVEQVSWDDCQTFITRLNQLTDKIYRLPTEAEWEYAARGGANSTYSYIYSGGNTLNDVAWNSNNSNSQTQTVGTKQANALGLYDMSGNVWEWCNDWYGNYSSSAVTKPQGPNSGFYRIYRGGGWNNIGGSIRVSNRDGDVPRNKRTDIGLRLAITNQYTLTTTISHGSITPTQKIYEGSQLKITYTADSGYKISAVYVNNIKQIGDSVIDFTNSKGYILVTADSNKTITVITAIRYPAVSAGLNLANLDSNMVPIPAGSFTMGATNEQLANNGDGYSAFWKPTKQQVTLSSYKICRFEVTQQLWQDVMGSNPSYFNGVDFDTNLQRPVEQVSWDDCQIFIDSLNKKTGKKYRLPTEAEWEYAARGGANSTNSYIYIGGDTLDSVAWNPNNSSDETHTVGTKKANALGLYDMSGNVWEWCYDWYGNYSNTNVSNPEGPGSGNYRVTRGGGWFGFPFSYRVSYRFFTGTDPIDFPPSYDLGLRLVLDSILPPNTTNAVTSITSITNTTATANINISNPNGLSITAAGVVYSSSNSTPTKADAYIAYSSTGNLLGNYTLWLSSLTANTTYYVRGYLNFKGTIYYGNVQTFTTTNLSLTFANLDSNMVLVPAGSFTMGATNEQLANNGDGYSAFWSPTKQQVTLSSYKICRFEVTQQLWQDVMGSNPSNFTGNLQRPVYQVSWDSCQKFIDSLNKKTGKNYRLPTEAEWEYAARGGANSTYSYIYSGGNTLNDVAWNSNNSNSQTQTVGTKQANALGLYDMSGNVWEWCSDWYGNYSNSAVTNPQGASSGTYRVYRGGSWYYDGKYYRVSYRDGNYPNLPLNGGLRLAITNQYTLTTTISHGSITPTQKMNEGSQLKITYTADSSYKISAVYVNNIKQIGDSVIDFTNSKGYILVTADSNKTITVITAIRYPAVSAGLNLANLDSNMVPVPADSFTIGCTNEQSNCNADERPTHQVTLSNYKICRFEVTQQLWQDVMGSNPSYFNGGSFGTNLQRPVEQVSWNDCQKFIDSLNKKTGKTYRLPTEAEWEYAARGGVNSTYSYIYSGGNTLNDVAWNSNNSSGQTQKVGTKKANALGLYDMSGNVSEWCSDWYGSYTNTADTNPPGAASGPNRVIRGGSWNSASSIIRVASRNGNNPSNTLIVFGLRLVITNQYTLTTTISHGSITPTQKMNKGSQLKITYTADSSYKISAVYVNNIKQIGDSVIDFTNSKGYILVTADSNKTITVITAIRYPAVSAGLNLANLDSNMVPVPADSFTIGCTNEQSNCNADERPTHQVTLSNYKICRFEVTQQLWQDVMGSNPSSFTGNLQRPVERVSWNDCQIFIDSLNKKTGKTYRLPTEAEWEYAARGGANSTYSYIYSGGNTLNDVAWNSNNSNSQTQTVGTKQANALGLYDMSGNVAEWCNDWYDNYTNTAVMNPQGAASGSSRVFRGGSWYNYGYARVSYRDYYFPSYGFTFIGFRLVITNQYTLTTTISHGSITPTQKIYEGSQLKITYTADSGYKISAVYVNNIKQIGDSVIDFTNSKGYILVTADSNKTITVITAIRYPAVSAGLNLANLDSNMVPVPAGSFTIGCTNEQNNCGADERPTNQVTLSNYKICRFEVTQQLWQDVMGSNPSIFTGNLQRPVDGVSWNDCQKFIDSLNKKTGKTYRLPTEAEWEYAARGGANSTYSYIYSGGNTLNDVAWNSNNSNSQTQTVGTKQANALGLYDMSGNVWEWCNDWYGNYSNTAVTNPQGPATGSYRVIRGGSWSNNGNSNRVSYRNGNYPSSSYSGNGIRLVFSSN